MFGQSSMPPCKSSQTSTKMSALLRDLSSDSEEEIETESHENPNVDPKKPWLAEFHKYLHSNDSDYLGDGISIIQWWGVSRFIRNGCIPFLLKYYILTFYFIAT